MKVTSELPSADCGDPGFPVANLHDLGIRDRELHSLEGTAEFEPFRQMFFDLDPLVTEDELILQLRNEALRLLPCDRVCVALSVGNLVQIFERSHGHQSTLIAAGSRTSIWSGTHARLIPEDMVHSLHCESGLQVPFKINGALAGTVSFLAKAPKRFRQPDTAIAQRIADSIGLVLTKTRNGHREPRFEAELTADWKDDLVRALCEVPDIHRILPQISNLVQAAIPHDRLSISFHDRDRYIWLRSVSNSDGPSFDRFQLSPKDCPQDGTSLIINDLLSHRPSMEPFSFHDKAVEAGYRSFLVRHVWTGQHGLGFVFWSKQRNAFHRCHIPSAQTIVDLCAVAASREALVPSVRTGSPGEAAPEMRGRPSYQQRDAFRTRKEPGSSEQRSALWSAVKQSAVRVASTDTTVLLIGETGTGKEVIARLIHSESARNKGPFVPVNSAALPDTLLESELFGFERGAFTGAYHHKRGYIELARHGVLFLDEVSELSLASQAKLLRVLETREFQSLGSVRPQKAEIRLICATNKDLREESRAGRFRADLYYRLCVFEISLPPLRQRREDILPLAYEFLRDMRGGPEPVTISPQAEDALLLYGWPGNVRELRNVIERASILCGAVVEAEHLAFRNAAIDHGEVNEISIVEKKMIERVLRECGGNKAQAARTLGLSRTQLYVRLRRYFGCLHPADRAQS
jgi:transcriptional regulator with GAF, ATPase, and Fis domain